MRTIAEIGQEHFGVSTAKEINAIFDQTICHEPEPPRTTPFHLSLPYTAANHPEAPPESELREALENNKLNKKNGLRLVYRVRDLVIKINTPQETTEEAENLIFLAENSQVRVPKVYYVCHDGEGNDRHGVLVMEFIEGFELSLETWTGFTEAERTTLCARLDEQFRLLRSIPSEGYYGRVHHQAFNRLSAMFRTNGKKSCGPYDTYEEYVAAVISSAEVNCIIGGANKGERLFEDQELMLSEYKLGLETCTVRKPVFTHVDPALKNIIFRQIPETQDQAADFEVTLIDWDGAGWLPAWVQGACFQANICMHDSVGNYNEDDDLAFVDRFYGDVECGAEMLRLHRKVRIGISHLIY